MSGIVSDILKKYLMENLIFCAVCQSILNKIEIGVTYFHVDMNTVTKFKQHGFPGRYVTFS